MPLPGVKVGPLDPEATSSFGQVAAQNSARVLLRLHRQMYPAGLIKQLARPRDDARTKGLDIDEVRSYVGGLSHPNGDPLVPEGAKIVGASVKGDDLTGRVLTFQYEMPSGRIGKWYAEYGDDVLPESFSNGTELARIHEMRERGLVAFDSEGTRAEIAERNLRNSRAEVKRLRAYVESGAQGDAPAEGDDDQTGSPDLSDQANSADEIERLRREHAEMSARLAEVEPLAQQAGEYRRRVAELETIEGAQGGNVPVGGLEGDVEDRGAQEQQPAESAGEGTVAGQDPPHEGYDELRADQVVERIKSEDTSDEDVRGILEYERSHANRRTVTGAAEQRLDRASG